MAVYRHEIPTSAPSPSQETLGGALAAAQGMPGRAGAELLTAAREAFTTGMHGAAIAGAVVLAGATALTATSLRQIHVRNTEE